MFVEKKDDQDWKILMIVGWGMGKRPSDDGMDIKLRVYAAGDGSYGDNSIVDQVKDAFPTSGVRGPYGRKTGSKTEQKPGQRAITANIREYCTLTLRDTHEFTTHPRASSSE